MEEVAKFYNDNPLKEFNRLDIHKVEYSITLNAIEKFGCEKPANIIDIGGGPGRYAIELTKKGYTVDLIDISQELLDLAKKESERQGIKINTIIYDCATQLSKVENEQYDMALVLGPMYHLLKEAERTECIKRALKKVKSSGYIFVSFMNLYSALRFSARRMPNDLKENKEVYDQLLEEGIFKHPSIFMNFYAMHPKYIRGYMEQFGLKSISIISCEGLLGGMDDSINQVDQSVYEEWEKVNKKYCEDEYLLASSDHLLYIGKKQ